VLTEISSKVDPSQSTARKKGLNNPNMNSTSYEQVSVNQAMLPTLNVSVWGTTPQNRDYVMTPQAQDTVAMLEANQLKIIRR
jgi:hypothetical protein